MLVVTQTAAEPEGVLMDCQEHLVMLAITLELTYTFPAGAEVWGGVANEDTSIYPLKFTQDGKIKFKASAPNGDVEVRFRFERLPYPDVDPAYDTATVTVTGAEEAEYEIAVPAQGENTFSSFLMYFNTRDVEAYVSEVKVVADATDSGGDDDSGSNTPSGGGTMVMNEAFGGTTIDGTTYTFPSGAEVWGGFSHDPTQVENLSNCYA